MLMHIQLYVTYLAISSLSLHSSTSCNRKYFVESSKTTCSLQTDHLHQVDSFVARQIFGLHLFTPQAQGPQRAAQLQGAGAVCFDFRKLCKWTIEIRV